MKAILKKLVRKALPIYFINLIQGSLIREISSLKLQTKCYAQEGEDLILETFLEDIKTGFYVDIGAFHPNLYSNTYLFYLKGWNGINIDPRPNSMVEFKKNRPRDINLEIPIGEEERNLPYYMFDEPALNGFSKEISEDRQMHTVYNIVNTIDLTIHRLENVLDQHLPSGQSIDFMTIDVEGLDLEVLKSNNWQKYKPSIILVETSVVYLDKTIENPIHSFLSEKNYSLVAKTFRTSFYQLNK